MPASRLRLAGAPGDAAAPRARLRHPGRAAIVVVVLLVVVNLGVVLLHEADTKVADVVRPNAIENVDPVPGALARARDSIAVDLRDELTGVLVLDRMELPQDQLDVVLPLGQVSFRPGPGKDVERLEPGLHDVTVFYWRQDEARPPNPGSYTWTFRAAA